MIYVQLINVLDTIYSKLCFVSILCVVMLKVDVNTLNNVKFLEF
jgi:hypothetical protein